MSDNENLQYENPFSSFYLAEQFVRDTEFIIKRGLLSPETFNIPELKNLIIEPMNHFVMGVPGSGKTMALAFLRVECLSLINGNEELKKEFKHIWGHIGRGLWGVYLGLLLNEELLSPKNFKGFGLEDETWTNIFGDFVNAIYIKQMLEHLSSSITEPGGAIATWLGFSEKGNEIKSAIKNFAEGVNMPEDCHTPEGLLKWAENRLKLYQKLIKERTSPKIGVNELPGSSFYSELGYLPIKLVGSLRYSGVLTNDQRVFFILDEYDQCELSGRTDFALSINSFVKSAARGFTPNLFVKVGTRPHGGHNKTVLGGNAKIEDGRDYREINLTILRLKEKRTLFSNLVQDIANRRLRNVEWFKERKIDNIKSLLEGKKPIEEADLYHSGKLPDRIDHFKVLLEYCGVFKDSKDRYEDLVSIIKEQVSETLLQKYMVILACRQLQRLKDAGAKDLDKGYEPLMSELSKMGEFIKVGDKIKTDSKLYYKLKDLREPALFLLAHDYKRPRYYQGFETIILMAEGVPLNCIKIFRTLFDEVGYNISSFEKTKKIDIIKQNRVIRKVAGEIRKEASAYLCNWQIFQILLDELGFIFREIQLSPTAPYPTPNGFSVEKETGWLLDSEPGLCNLAPGKDMEKLKYLKTILSEAIDWGYFIEMPHRSKTGSMKTRMKYYINSMIAPYYDLSVRHLKEPLYTGVDELISLCSTDKDKRGNMRKNIMNRIRSLMKLDNSNDQNGNPVNKGLFGDINEYK